MCVMTTFGSFSSSRIFSIVVAFVFTGLATGLIALVNLFEDVSNVSMLYLLAVIASAVLFGSGAAILTSIVSFLAFNLFFIEPKFTLVATDTSEWLALSLLLLTGVVTGQLAAALRNRVQEAEMSEREAVVLYDVVRLLVQPQLDQTLKALAERLRTELSLAAVIVVLNDDGPLPGSAEAGDSEALETALSAFGVPKLVLGSGRGPTLSTHALPGHWIRVVSPSGKAVSPIRSGHLHKASVNAFGKETGIILLMRRAGNQEFSHNDTRLISAVANQLGIALERLHLQTEATEAEILRRTDELRGALLNAVSHDLRSPLSSIIASAGSLLQDDVSWTEGERKDFAEAIEEEAQRLNRLVGNLLDLSRIEAGSLRPEKGWYDLGSLINEVLGRVRRSTNDQHRLIVYLPDELPPLSFDYVEIDQVLSNLIENAIKHAPSGTVIEISAEIANDEVKLEVADRGPGLPTDAIPHLFQPFYQIQTVGVRPRGSGLGLAVAKGLVEAHRGRIWAENRTDGGARFMFTLPIVSDPIPATKVV